MKMIYFDDLVGVDPGLACEQLEPDALERDDGRPNRNPHRGRQ